MEVPFNKGGTKSRASRRFLTIEPNENAAAYQSGYAALSAISSLGESDDIRNLQIAASNGDSPALVRPEWLPKRVSPVRRIRPLRAEPVEQREAAE